MVKQTILSAENDYKSLDIWLTDNKIARLLLVCDRSLSFLTIKDYFGTLPERLGVKVVKFDDFQPNPLYESVVEGVALFKRENCQAIIAVGGGSSIDVAKCIKLYSNMDSSQNYLKQPILPNNIPLLAMPTTAGTGSEATRYAVIYYEGVKQSVADESCIPSAVLMDSSALKTLPLYQKKSTMLDALCHALESFWSVNSTDQSKAFSRSAIEMILSHMDGYLANDDVANTVMLKAANLAGKAINITQTTAGHAMCYKLTSLYGIAHGHAAALCDKVLFLWMIQNTDKCIDLRGEEYLKQTFHEIAQAMRCSTPEQACEKWDTIIAGLQLEIPAASQEDYQILKTSVNPTRLKNHPIQLDADTIDMLYHRFLSK